jgi:hypothetical protein
LSFPDPDRWWPPLLRRSARGGGKKLYRAASWTRVAGDEQEPGDEQQGAWTRQERERMDQAVAERMARVLRQRIAGGGND